jgi:hypothetical protein
VTGEVVMEGWFAIMAECRHLCNPFTSTNGCQTAFRQAETIPLQDTCATRPHLRWSWPRKPG